MSAAIPRKRITPTLVAAPRNNVPLELPSREDKETHNALNIVKTSIARGFAVDLSEEKGRVDWKKVRKVCRALSKCSV